MTDNIPFQQFSIIDDPRQKGKILHPLLKIFVITLSATLAGADNWTAIVEFAKARIDWLSGFVDMSTGVPSHDTWNEFFR